MNEVRRVQNPLSVLEKMIPVALDNTATPLALREDSREIAEILTQIILEPLQEALKYKVQALERSRKTGGDVYINININKPVINISPFLDYHSNTNTKTENNPVVNFFSVPRAFKVDSVVSHMMGTIMSRNPVWRKLREEGDFRTEYAREVEIEGPIIATTPDSDIVYTAGKAVVDWPTGMKIDILGMFDKQESDLEGKTALQLGRLDFDGSRKAFSKVYKDPNLAFYGINGEKITRNQVPGVPRLYVGNCKLKFNR